MKSLEVMTINQFEINKEIANLKDVFSHVEHFHSTHSHKAAKKAEEVYLILADKIISESKAKSVQIDINMPLLSVEEVAETISEYQRNLERVKGVQ